MIQRIRLPQPRRRSSRLCRSRAERIPTAVTAAEAAAVASRSADRSVAAPTGSLTIGEVARRSGFSIKALRFYERRGLLPASGRSAGGFRLYSEADLHRLEF